MARDEIIADAPIADVVPVPAVEPVADPLTEIYVDLFGTGGYEIRVGPNGRVRDRELWIDGIACEHCDDAPNGVWRYRASR